MPVLIRFGKFSLSKTSLRWNRHDVKTFPLVHQNIKNSKLNSVDKLKIEKTENLTRNSS